MTREDLVRVYNRGKKPIVYERSFRGVLAIHPGKYIDTSPAHAKELYDEYPDAVAEDVFKGKTKAREVSKKSD